MKPDFDASSWKIGPAGFGEKDTPGAVVRTDWTTNDIWIRRTFELKDVNFTEPQLLIHHDEDAEVYINGKLVRTLRGYTTAYRPVALAKEARDALQVGRNTIAVHCHQTGGGQSIDLGLVEIDER